MKFNSLAVHGGYQSQDPERAAVPPIYQSTSFTFANMQHGADLFDLKVLGNIYTRINNPTNTVLEQRISLMEGAAGSLVHSSGMAAIANTLFTLCAHGDNIVANHKLYGGTYSFFANELHKFGIEARLVHYDEIPQSIDERTKLVFCESIGNPSGDVANLEELSACCKKEGVALVVDNTVATPYLCRPIDYGADIVVHSLTKYMGGHGNSIGGVIVDSGLFDWKRHAKRYPYFSKPDPSYHNLVFTEALGNQAFIWRARLVPMRGMGAALSPFNSFLILQGLETLPLRMVQHSRSAKEVAIFLEQHPKITWVRYAGLPSHPDAPLIKRYMRDAHASGILSFGVSGGRDAAQKTVDSLQMILRLVNIGDARSLACHPASTTHRQLNASELEAAGVSEDLVRISVGIEDTQDIIEDLSQALDH